MPYIKEIKRENIRPLLRGVSSQIITAGDLTYAITYLMHLYAMAAIEPDFERLSNAWKAAGCAAAEFYRTVIAPYEDEKRKANGPVSHLDA